MYLAYTDESGDSGYVNSRTKWLVISCVVVHELAWQETLEKLIKLRQELKQKYGLPVRAEIKAAHLVYGRGAIKDLGLSPYKRIALFEELLEFEAKELEILTFAIAIAKMRIASRSTVDPREKAWQYVTQRIDTFCRKLEGQGKSEKIMLLPDEGHGPMVRQIMRKARRFQTITGWYGSTLDIRAKCLVEDPVEKNSAESYFTQLADWNAYAAHRCQQVDPISRAPNDLWERLGDIRHSDVNSLTGGPTGIVVWPRN